MKRVLFLFAVLVCFAGKANAQSEIAHFASDPATCDPTRGMLYYNTTSSVVKYCSATNTWTQVGASSFPVTTPVTVGSGGSITTTGTGFIVAGSNVNNFFNKFFGLSPTDSPFNAKGDTHVFYDCGMTTNNHVTCTSGHFVAADVTKWFESCAANCGTAPTINQGTITAFNSATDVTVSMSAGTTYSNTKLAYGTDDDAAMQAWAAAMVAAPTNGVPPQARGGYLPAGGFAIKQPLQIKYPACATQGQCDKGEAAPSATMATGLRPSLWLMGQGTTSSFIYVRTAAIFTWPTQTTNVAAFYVKDFDFSTVSNFAIAADFTAHNTTGITGAGFPAGVMNDNSTHAMWNGLWIQGFHNTTNNLCGFMNSYNDFESTYSYFAVEANDFNGCLGQDVPGGNPSMEKIQFNTMFWENPIQNQNVRIGGAANNLNLKQISFNNNHSFRGNTASFNFLATTTTLGETIQFSGFRQQANGTSSLGFVTNAGISNVNIDCHGCYLEDIGGAAGNLLVDNTSASSTINFYGGALSGSGLTNLFNNAGNIFIYGTKISAGPTVANIQTGAGFTYSFIPVAGANGGWTGKGGIQGTLIVSNQGAACTNGELALSAGWGTTASVASVSGTGQTCQWQITSSGTGQAANPTITDTLTNPLPTATTVCDMRMTGGTGTSTLIQLNTLSATAPVFQFNGTPVAASTYVVMRRCGP